MSNAHNPGSNPHKPTPPPMTPGQQAEYHATGTHGLPAVKVNPAAVNYAPGTGRMLVGGLWFVGAVCLVLTVVLGLGGGKDVLKHAVAAYHVGFLYTVSLALGSLGLVMMLHQFSAGWSSTVRRQLENVAALMPFCLLLGLPVLAIELASNGLLFKWMNPAVRAEDALAAHKSGFLNPVFFSLRAAIYFAIWIGLSRALYRYSRTQDQTGDRWLTAKARYISSFGLILFALSTAFAGFDWLMSMDFHWFSTMWGVYFFAGNQVAAVGLLVFVCALILRTGKLQGMVTAEHFHDMGKLLLAFTVFWAYIAFSQYFLIWYSNIPEETAWYVLRNSHGWHNVAVFLSFGHFIVPFLILLWRGAKRRTIIVAALASWLLFIHAVDLFFVVRPHLSMSPDAYPNSTGLERWWIDVVGFLGPVSIFAGLIVRQIVTNPLIPVNDPRLPEALEHKNYV